MLDKKRFSVVVLLVVLIAIVGWVLNLEYDVIQAQRANVVLETTVKVQTIFGELEVQSVGSGVCISNDGYIVTAGHCTRGVTKMKVTLSDGRTFTSTDPNNWYADPDVDVGFIKIQTKIKNFIPFAKSSKASGLVFAVGNSLGIWDNRVSFGTIYRNHFSRNVLGDDNSYLFLKIKVYPGNSGSGVYHYGQLIGVVSMGGKTIVPVCFAVPVEDIQRVLDWFRLCGVYPVQ